MLWQARLWEALKTCLLTFQWSLLFSLLSAAFLWVRTDWVLLLCSCELVQYWVPAKLSTRCTDSGQPRGRQLHRARWTHKTSRRVLWASCFWAKWLPKILLEDGLLEALWMSDLITYYYVYLQIVVIIDLNCF